MTVYRLEQDPDRWNMLTPKGQRHLFAFSVPDHLEEGDSRAGEWKPPPVEWVDSDLEDGDFSMPDSGALIAHPRAAAIMRPLLEEAGEVLPVPHGGETYDFLHVTRYVDGLDWDRAKVDRDGEITRYAFLPEQLADVGLFKIATTERKGKLVMDLELYVVADHRAPERDFVALFRRHGLRGLEFEKVWSSA